MEAEPSTLTLSTLFPQTTDCHAIRHRFDFDLSPKLFSEAFNDVWLRTASMIAIQASFSDADEPVLDKLGDSLPEPLDFVSDKPLSVSDVSKTPGFGDAKDIQNGGNS